MKRFCKQLVLMTVLIWGSLPLWAQSTAGRVLATVRIPQQVLAGGEPLQPGTYELRLTGEHPPAQVGQSPDAQEWVELVAADRVIAREVAEILLMNDRAEAVASSRPAADGTQVAVLDGGEFLRVAVTEGDVRYLLHFPMRP